MPIVTGMGFDPIWFGVLILVNLEAGGLTPPFGLILFVMKGVAPEGTTMEDIIRSAMPILGLVLIGLVLVLVFPALALWLPAMMRPLH